jgi:ATP-dependent RNA helicase DeaD
MQLPTASAINAQRIIAFKQRISDALAENALGIYEQLVNEYANESGAEPMQIAAALARLAQGIEPLLLVEKAPGHTRENSPREQRSRKQKGGTKPTPLKDFPDIEMCRYRVEVGHNHNVKPGNIVGAIANEADLESRYIGSIDIYDDYSTVDLPSGMPKEIFHDLRKARVCGRKLNISELSVGNDKKPPQRDKKKAKSKTGKTTGKRKPNAAKKSHAGGGQKRKQSKRRKRATD